MTPEVSLRTVRPDDLPAFYEHQRDTEAARLAAFRPRELDAFMTHWNKLLANPENVARTIVADGKVAGHIGAWTQGGERLVCYWIGREFWSRGIATAALGRFLREFPERPVVARVAQHNRGSIRVLQKCGFVAIGEEAYTEPDGQRLSELIFSLSDPPPAFASPACSMPEIRD